MTRALRWMVPAVLVVAFVAGVSNATAQVKGWPSESPPKPLPARPAPFPPYEIRTLANGLQVVAVNHHEQPLVTAQLLVQAGAAFDPPGKAGVANLVAQLLDQGTTSMTAGEIADAVDSAGAELTVLSGTEVTFAQVTVMIDRFDFGLGMLSDVVRHPAFEQEELDRQRQQLRSTLQVNYEDPDYLAEVAFRRLVFGRFPYGMPGEGTPDSIAGITRDDLVEFHRRFYAPNNCILAIVGDVTAEDAFAAAERVFGGWARREVVPPAFDPPPPPEREVVVIDKPGAVQTEIRVGHLAMARNHQDYFAVDLAIRVLGGEGGNRLQQVLRQSRGLTYGASADLQALRMAGVIRAETDTRSAATGEALRLIVDEFFKIQREVVAERELDDAKAYLIGSFPIGLETPGSISTKVLNSLFHGLPLKDLERHRDLVSAVTPDRIERVMRAHLRPDRLTVVLVGQAELFVPLLRGVGFKTVEVVPLSELDLSRPDLRRRSTEAATQRLMTSSLTSREEWDRAKAVVLRAIEAAGGDGALRAIRTLAVDADTVLTTPAGVLRASTRTFVQYPDRFRVDARTPDGDVVQAWAAGTAWIADKRGPRDAPPPMVREAGLSIRRDWIALLLAAADDRLTGRRLDAERGLAGRPLDVVELWASDLPPVKLAIDSDTGRLVRLSYQAPGPRGTEDVTETFDDFRPVDGVQYPHRAVTRRDNAPLLERTITSLRVNPVLEPGLFEKPK